MTFQVLVGAKFICILYQDGLPGCTDDGNLVIQRLPELQYLAR